MVELVLYIKEKNMVIFFWVMIKYNCLDVFNGILEFWVLKIFYYNEILFI